MSTHHDGTHVADAQDAWLWGWDDTPGIVSVWADRDGSAYLWRRDPECPNAPVTLERRRFRPWLLLRHLDDVAYGPDGLVASAGSPLADGAKPARDRIVYTELEGPGVLRYLISADDGRRLERAVLAGASRRRGRDVRSLRDLGDDALSLAPEEQFLVATGATYFRHLAFEHVHRLQFDLETTGLYAERDRIFLIAVRDSRGFSRVLDIGESDLTGNAAERDLILRLAALVRERDPDVLENHNIHGFDLPFLARRAELLGVPLHLGRAATRAGTQLQRRSAPRGYGMLRSDVDAVADETGTDADEDELPSSGSDGRSIGSGGTRGAAGPNERGRFTVPGREVIDTLDAVWRYDFAARDLPGHGLKAVARHFGLAAPDRVYVEGAAIFATWRREPDRVRKYALDDVAEAAGVSRLLGGSAFALAQMTPRRYERIAEAGPATGILDPLLVRAYLHKGHALPARSRSDGTSHSGASLVLYACGVAHHVVKCDVASLYPSIMRQFRVVSKTDTLGALLALVDRLVDLRLDAKARSKTAPAGSDERYSLEAFAAATKVLVNSAYGYLAAPGLTRFADVHAANEITSRGRDILALLCHELAVRGATLLEADTDGVYFAVPETWDEQRERRLVAEVGALLPPLIRLEFEGRYAAMLSHEAKNYALLAYPSPDSASAGRLTLRGVAFRSVRAEPFGEDFLRRALLPLLRRDIAGVRAAFVEMVTAVRQRQIATEAVCTRVRLTKTPQAYRASPRKEAAYEALLASGRTSWQVGEYVSIYRARGGLPRLAPPPDTGEDPRDYDVNYYTRLLRETYAARLARAFAPEDYDVLFGDPEQPSLFAPPIEDITTRLTALVSPP